MQKLLGIYPGLDGAIAILDVDGDLLAVSDMPKLLGEGAKNRRSVKPVLLADIIRNSGAIRAFVGLTGPRPTDGSVSAFGFGRSKGQIEGVCAALALPITFVPPVAWKRHADIPPGRDNKDIARSRAIARWPQHSTLFARKCDCDRAEAALIGLAGLANRKAPELRRT